MFFSDLPPALNTSAQLDTHQLKAAIYEVVWLDWQLVLETGY